METMDILKKPLMALGYFTETLLLGRTKKSFTLISHPDHDGTMMMSTMSPLYPFTTASARLICKDKSFAYDYAMHRGISTPQSVYIEKDASCEAAETLLQAYGRVIVKPLDSSLSNGLTLGITTQSQLAQAIIHAGEFSDTIIVQQEVMGEEIRFVVVNGKVEAAILRQTPSVIGDGISTLRQLIDKENEARKKIVDTVVEYPMIDNTLFNLDSFDMDKVNIPGERIEFTKSTMISGGASIYNIIDTIDVSYVALVEKLARPMGEGFFVVDMMLMNYKVSATAKNYAFIEFNMTPAIKLFYSCRDGKHFQVAEKFLAPMIDTLLKKGERDDLY